MRLILTALFGGTTIFGFTQQQPELLLPVSHTSGITVASFTNSGEYLLTASDDKTVKIWDVNSAKLFIDLKGHTDKITSAQFSRDGKQVLTASHDKSVRLWNIATGDASILLHQNSVTRATFSNDGKLFATSCLSFDGVYGVSASAPGKAQVYAYPSGKLVSSFEPKSSDVTWVAFSKDDKLIATAAYKKVDIWNVASGKQLQSLTTNAEKAEFSMDGKYLFTISSYEDEVVAWDVATGAKLSTLKGHEGKIVSLAFSPDGKYLATSDLYTTKLWDISKGISSYATPVKTYSEGGSAAFDITSAYLFAYSVDDNKTSVYDLKQGTLLRKFAGELPAMPLNVVSNNNKYLVVYVYKKDIKLVDYASGVSYKTITQHTDQMNNVQVSAKGNLIAAVQSGSEQINIIDGNTGKVINKMPIKGEHGIYGLQTFKFSNDEKLFITGDAKTAYVYETGSGKQIKSVSHPANIRSLLLTHDDKILVTIGGKTAIAWDLSSGSKLYAVDGEFSISTGANCSPDGKYIALVGYKQLFVIEAANGKMVYTFKDPIGMYKDCAFSSDGKFLVGVEDYTSAYVWSMATGKLVRRLDTRKKDLASVSFSGDGNQIVTINADGEAICWDAQDAFRTVDNPWRDSSAKIVGRFSLEKNAYRYTISFSPAKNWLVINANSEIAVYDIGTMQKSFGWIGIDEDDYLIKLPGNYYTVTPNAARWVNWKVGSTIYDFDQWDIKFNRPDLVLKALKNTDTALIKAYEDAYRKRLKKAGIEEDMLTNDYHVPEISIVGNYPSVVDKSNTLKIRIKASETLKNTSLQKILVYVNGNPVFGKNGYTIYSKAKDTTMEVTIPLNTGTNQVKVSCINNRGAESLRKKLYLNYEPATRPRQRIWYIGVGVSKYKDNKFNLTYAEKDIKDLSATFKQKVQDNLTTLILNEDATASAIKAVNQKLIKEVQPDDVIILSFSGHGLIGKNYNFYFATHDIDFQEPAAKGLSFDDIEMLLDKVPSSRKLVLIDACHSGEMDADEIDNISTGTPTNVNVKQVKGFTIINKKKSLNNKSSFELMQEMFTTNNASNGATIISAAAATEYAFEGQSWNNGVFTYCILSALKEKKADINKDGQISITELQKYVSSEVKQLTGGKQKPTSRQVNYENDWIIW